MTSINDLFSQLHDELCEVDKLNPSVVRAGADLIHPLLTIGRAAGAVKAHTVMYQLSQAYLDTLFEDLQREWGDSHPGPEGLDRYNAIKLAFGALGLATSARREDTS